MGLILTKFAFHFLIRNHAEALQPYLFGKSHEVVITLRLSVENILNEIIFI